MSEWRGPWKCEKCGETFTPEFGRERIRDELCHYGPGESGICSGKLVPYERRAADEQAQGLVKACEEVLEMLEAEIATAPADRDTDPEREAAKTLKTVLREHRVDKLSAVKLTKG